MITVHKSLVALVLGALVTLAGVASFMPQEASSATAGGIFGYAWSDTIGWLSLNCEDTDSCGTSNYGLTVAADGTISGYAWSEHIGWVSANGSDLTGCPSAPCTARMEGSGMAGWMKARVAGDGWDGFISLNGSSPDYGPMLTAGSFSGFAWGSDVVGWLDFQFATTDYLACSPPYQCVDATHYDDACTAPIESFACDPGLICAVGVVPCVIPGNASGELDLDPSLVPTGNTTAVSWEVIDTVSCRVFGDNGDEWFGGGVGAETSQPIVETTLYTLECTNGLGEATTTVDTAYATVVPTWVER